MEQIHALEDAWDSSDEVGLAHIKHDGPFTVHIEESIEGFFGVESVADITEEMLQAARAEFAARPKKQFSIEVTRTVTVTTRIVVEAVDVYAAERKALEQASKQEFPSPGKTEYVTGDATEALE